MRLTQTHSLRNGNSSIAGLNSKKKLLKFENFEISICSTEPQSQSQSQSTVNNKNQSQNQNQNKNQSGNKNLNQNQNQNSNQNLSKDFPTEFLKSSSGGFFSFNTLIRTDPNYSGGQIETSDIDIHIPNLLFQFNECSVKYLLQLVSVLFPSNGKNTTENDGKNVISGPEKTQWEKEFNIDLDNIPKATLRTLLWLEQQNNQNSDNNSDKNTLGQDDEIFDYSRLTEIMKNYLLSRKSFEENSEVPSALKGNNSKEHSFVPSSGTFFDSDSGEDFPDNCTGSESERTDDSDSTVNDNEDDNNSGNESEDFDFQDAAQGEESSYNNRNSRIKIVKMGVSTNNLSTNTSKSKQNMSSSSSNSKSKRLDKNRNKKINSKDRDSCTDMSKSAYGMKSIATMGSEMFHSTRQGSSTSFSTSFSTARNLSAERDSAIASASGSSVRHSGGQRSYKDENNSVKHVSHGTTSTSKRHDRSGNSGRNSGRDSGNYSGRDSIGDSGRDSIICIRDRVIAKETRFRLHLTVVNVRMLDRTHIKNTDPALIPLSDPLFNAVSDHQYKSSTAQASVPVRYNELYSPSVSIIHYNVQVRMLVR